MEDDRMHNTGRLGRCFDAERDVGSLDTADKDAMFAVASTRSPNNTTMDTTHEDASPAGTSRTPATAGHRKMKVARKVPGQKPASKSPRSGRPAPPSCAQFIARQ
jgi:hypothetical protein